ncbi:MAG: ankyrin repeat domain-containing protein [Gallionella sp.]
MDMESQLRKHLEEGKTFEFLKVLLEDPSVLATNEGMLSDDLVNLANAHQNWDAEAVLMHEANPYVLYGYGGVDHPMQYAINNGRKDLVGFFLDQGYYLEDKRAEKTALHYATEADREDFSLMIIERYPEQIRTLDSDRRTPEQNSEHQWTHSLMDYATQYHSGKETPLHTLLREGRLEDAKAMMEAHPEMLDAVNHLGKRPFEGCDIQAVDRNGNTPLHYAAAVGLNVDVLDLVRRGCDVNEENDRGFTPIDWAQQVRNERTLETLDDLSQRSRGFDRS